MKMHYCTCQINLAGQGFHVLQILETEPMSWPEVQIMMALHGEENIFDIKPVAIGETDRVNEKRRLSAKYRQTMVVEQVFPGRDPNMELLMPGQPEDQAHADEFGAAVKPVPSEDDDAPLGGLEPPIGPAIFKPGKPRPFPGVEAT